MSPHRLTGSFVSLPWATTSPMRRSTAGCSGSLKAATRPPPSREAAITYWVRSLLPIEKKAAGSVSIARAEAGVSTMMPRGGIVASVPSARSSARQRSKNALASSSSAAMVTIGSITFSGPSVAARSSARTCGLEKIRPVEAEAEPAQAEEGVALRWQADAGQRLVAAHIERADDERLALEPCQQPGIGGVLLRLVRQAVAPEEQKLGAHQADAVGRGQRRIVDGLGIVDIDHHLDRLAGRGDGRLAHQRRRLSGLGPQHGEAALVALPRDAGRIEDQETLVGIEHGQRRRLLARP